MFLCGAVPLELFLCGDALDIHVIDLSLICFSLIHQDRDKFGNDITYLARPLPVEYLIIDVSTTRECLI